MAKGKKKEDAPPPGSPAWMTTYGDLMTLLLCFFVLLVSMSTMEVEKFKAAAASLKGALSVLPFQEQTIPNPMTPKTANQRQPRSKRTSKSEAVKKLERLIQEKNLGRLIEVKEISSGIHIIIGDPALFDSGSAVIKTQIYAVLDGVAEIVKEGDVEDYIRVEGHTDNVPINTPQYKNNWELSISRSLSVIRYIKENNDIDPKRLLPVGCGEYHPIESNDTPEGRAINRRVELYIVM